MYWLARTGEIRNAIRYRLWKLEFVGISPWSMSLLIWRGLMPLGQSIDQSVNQGNMS